MKNINIIAPNIKNGGGKELLEYLLEHLCKYYEDVQVTVYLDNSMQQIEESKSLKVVFLDNSFNKIQLFYKKLDNSLYFGNLPPLRKSQNSMVYFHNLYLLMSAKKLFSFSFKLFIKYILQQWYIYSFIKNIDVVACQNKLIKELFINKYKFKDVEILPFFRLCEKKIDSPKHKEYDFCYVSLAHPHKNHVLLVEAMKILSNEGIAIRLAVTVESDRKDLIDKINEINNIGVVKIDNLGVLPKSKVCKLYAQSKCLIFPSKEETFGLGLIEAVDMGLDVIAADLNYVYEVIIPSIVFNPDSAKMCANAIKEYMNTKQKKSISLVNNEIDTLIHKLIKGQTNVQK